MKFGSLFSGIGGFDLGFEQAGLSCSWQVEIDGDCGRVLEKHWNGVTRYKDVRDIGELGSVDVICGGFPCQDLSVAGKRAGLAGERSGLWFEFLRIVGLNRPRWIVIENVPGLLSSDEGRDFALILRGLVECGYLLAWRIVDAQFYGVAQRRRRVFIVGSLGDGSAAEILFESESVQWNPPTRREAGPGVTPILEAGARTNGDGHRDGDGIGVEGDPMFTLQSGKQHAVARALTGERGQRNNGTEQNYVAMPLKAKANSSHDESHETYIPVAYRTAGNCGPFEQGDKTGALNTNTDPSQNIICFSSKDHGADAGEIAPTLRSQNFKDSHMNGGGQVAIAFTERTRSEGRTFEAQEELAYAITNPGSGGRTHSRQIAGQFGVRRLTPTECERLQGFPEVKRGIIVEVCLDHLKNPANADNQNHKSQRHVGGAARIKSRKSAKSARRNSPQSNQSDSGPAPLSVLINCGENEVEILSQEKSLLYANTAGRQSGYPLPIKVENFVQLIAGMSITAEQIIQTGEAASLENGQCSIHHENGRPLVRLSGSEITQLVSDAMSGSTTHSQPSKSITSNPSKLSPLEQRLATSFCSVWVAMIGCIPELTESGYSYLRLQLNTSFDWTLYDANGKEISDSSRYRMLGNAVCVNVSRWIAERIVKVAKQ